MDKKKIGVMFDGFLLDLLSTEVVEDEEVEEALAETESDDPELFEEPEDGWNVYDKYMFRLANRVMEEYGLSRESTMEAILGCASMLADKKHVPATPKGEVEVEDLHAWVKAAEEIRFENLIIGIVESVMADAIEETKDEPDED